MTRVRRAAIAILLPLAVAASSCAGPQQRPPPPRAAPTTLPATAVATAPVAAPDAMFAAWVDELVKIELRRNCFGTTSDPSGAVDPKEPATQP